MKHAPKPRKLLHRIMQLDSPWVTVYADRLLDDTGQELEYWHYDRPDSAVVIVVQGDQLLLPAPVYRVGIGEVTLDFAGGRIPKGKTPEQAARAILQKELGFGTNDIVVLKPLNAEPFAVDSSFSSQKLYGFVAQVRGSARPGDGVQSFLLAEAQQLRTQLRCGQCRLLLGEFLA